VYSISPKIQYIDFIYTPVYERVELEDNAKPLLIFTLTNEIVFPYKKQLYISK